MDRVIVVSGPTASGKSEFAVQLAERLNGEIISADSVAVYIGFDVGSAKPSEELQQRIPHHLVSKLNAAEDFSAGKFGERGRSLVREIIRRGKVPIVSGGTGLYVRALISGLIKDEEKQLDLEEQPQEERYSRLKSLDPESAAKIDSSDKARTRRALEFALRTGKSIAEQREAHRADGSPLLCALMFVLEPERAELYARINRRVDEMLEGGLIEETKGLLERNPPGAKPFSAIGYRHAIQFLADGDGERLKSDLSRDTRRFAKRQVTWWRNQPERLGWKEVAPTEQPFEMAAAFVERSGDFSQDAVRICRLQKWRGN